MKYHSNSLNDIQMVSFKFWLSEVQESYRILSQTPFKQHKELRVLSSHKELVFLNHYYSWLHCVMLPYSSCL